MINPNPIPSITKDNLFTYGLAAWSSILLILYTVATILIVTMLGGPPQTVSECFDMLRENRINGLLRLDVLTVFIMPLYFVLFYALYLALKDLKPSLITLSTLFIFAGVILFLASPSVFSYLHLSDASLLAKTESEKSGLYAAAEAILSADIWHGTGARVGGILVQTGATVVSVIMLRSSAFTKLTAYTGIVTHGLDLAHIIIGFFLPAIGNAIMGVAGVLYILWFPLITAGLFHLAKNK